MNFFYKVFFNVDEPIVNLPQRNYYLEEINLLLTFYSPTFYNEKTSNHIIPYRLKMIRSEI